MKQGYYTANELIREFGAVIGVELATINDLVQVNSNEIESKSFLKMALNLILQDSYKYKIFELLQNITVDFSNSYVTRQKVEYLPFAEGIRLFRPVFVQANDHKLKEGTLKTLLDSKDSYIYGWNQNGIYLFKDLVSLVKPKIAIEGYTYNHFYDKNTENLNQAIDTHKGKDVIIDGEDYIGIDAEWLLTALFFIYAKNDVSQADLLPTFQENYQRVLTSKLDNTIESTPFCSLRSW